MGWKEEPSSTCNLACSWKLCGHHKQPRNRCSFGERILQKRRAQGRMKLIIDRQCFWVRILTAFVQVKKQGSPCCRMCNGKIVKRTLAYTGV